MCPPQPPSPAFFRTFKTTLAVQAGTVRIAFYAPSGYKQWAKDKKYPVIVNFHGGGFTLGTSTDDARWAAAVTREVDALVASVDYRMAPEHFFPTSIDDGADAVLYLAEHANEFSIDVDKIAVGGFSAGGNMAFTVPLRLEKELLRIASRDSESQTKPVTPPTPDTKNTSITRSTSTTSTTQKDSSTTAQRPRPKIAVIYSWYPSCDHIEPREQKRAGNRRPDQNLPKLFTDLFDDCYLYPPTTDKAHPYLSPGAAPKELLACLPEEIILFTCEYDMLLAEAEKFKERLVDELGKNVYYHMVPDVAHAWDKAPNPWRLPKDLNLYYSEACSELRRVLGVERPG